MAERPPLVPAIAPAGGRPGEYAELAPDAPRSRRRRHRGVLAAVACGLWFVAAVGVVTFLGLGGWRYGWLGALVVVPAGAGAVAWLASGPGFPGRGIWTTAAVVLALSLGATAAGAAPDSAGRLHEDIALMRFNYQFYTATSSVTRGHGWCAPQCPEVIQMYRAPNGSYQEALVIALAGLHRLGLVGDLKEAYNRQRGLQIFRQNRKLVAHITISRDAAELVEVKVDLLSRR